jgi:hypothetical protein
MLALLFLGLLAILLRQQQASADIALPPLSCAGALIPQIGDGFCSFVDWWSARAYHANNFTYSSTGEVMNVYEHQRIAALFYRDLFDNIQNNTERFENTQECIDAVYTLACMQAYPQCPLTDLGLSTTSKLQAVSYIGACQVHCMLVHRVCIDPFLSQGTNKERQKDLSKWLQCEQYPLESCAMHIDPTAYFVIDPQKMPIDGLQTIYTVFLVLWIVITAITYRVWMTAERSKLVENLTAFCLPFMKNFVMIFALSFWKSCVQAVCSRWLLNAMTNTHVVYETLRLLYVLVVLLFFLLPSYFLVIQLLSAFSDTT